MAEEGKTKKDLLEKISPILLVATIGLAFAVGVLWQRVNNLENRGGNNNVAGAPQRAEPYSQLDEEQAKNIPAINEGDHIRGNPDAKITLVEYSDFECPYCQRFHSTAQQALDEYGDDIRWVYRHFPLSLTHPNAEPAALASECVAELGGNETFWSFADAIFTDQSGTLNDLSGVAVDLGLNQTAFDSCLSEKRYQDKVTEQYEGGSRAGVTGTPGNFILNDKGEAWIVPGAVQYSDLKAAIEEALAS